MGKAKKNVAVAEVTNVVEEVVVAEVETVVDLTIDDLELIGAVEAIIVKEERRGRKVSSTSARQIRLATKAALEEAGISTERGRKIDPTSERQKRLDAFASKWGNKEIKRGRPKLAKTETVVEAKAE